MGPCRAPDTKMPFLFVIIGFVGSSRAKSWASSSMPYCFAMLLDALRRVHADREDDHVELLLDDPFFRCRVPDGHVVGDRVFLDDRRVAPEEAHAGEVLGPLVVALEVLAVGAHVVVEDRALRVRVVVLRQDDLLLGVGAADRRAVRVAALDHLAGADALDPGDVVRVLQVRFS